MNRSAFSIGFMFIVAIYYFMKTESLADITVPVSLQGVNCDLANTKAALAHFDKVAIYQLCLIPTNIEKGIKNLDIQVYFTTPHVDCNKSGNQMCESFANVSLQDNKHHELYMNSTTPKNSLFSFSLVPSVHNEPITAGEYQFELKDNDINWPQGMRAVSPIICDAESLRPWGQEHFVECWATVEKLGAFFIAKYNKTMPYREKFEYSFATNELNRWFGVMDKLVVDTKIK